MTKGEKMIQRRIKSITRSKREDNRNKGKKEKDRDMNKEKGRDMNKEKVEMKDYPEEKAIMKICP